MDDAVIQAQALSCADGWRAPWRRPRCVPHAGRRAPQHATNVRIGYDFHEQLGKRHGYTLGYTVTKLHLHRAGLVQAATKRSAHRKKRPRRPMVGMMLHQDASTHAWLAGDAGKHDLVVTMDDATSAIYSMFLVDEEGTASSLRGVREVVAKHGLFCSLYTDRGSHYFLTPEAGGRVSKTVLTQVGRALKQLGIEHIAAYSPQARGRSERAFSTPQLRGWLAEAPRRRPRCEPHAGRRAPQHATNVRIGYGVHAGVKGSEWRRARSAQSPAQ